MEKHISAFTLIILTLSLISFAIALGATGDTSAPAITFVAPTPSQGSTTGNSVMLNASIANTGEALAFFNDGLVAWYRLDDSGTAIDDSSSNNNDGTAVNGAAASPGAFKGAYSFDGVDDAITVPYTSSLNTPNEVTLAAWVRTGSGDREDIISRFQSTASYNGYALVLNPQYDCGGPGIVGLWVGDDSNRYLCSVQPVNDGNWHLVVGTYSALTARVYIDGEVNAIGTRFNGLAETAQNMKIGQESISSGRTFNGSIDEVMVFNRALSESEVRALYDATQSGLQRDLSELSAGSHSYTASAVDTDGNTATATRSFTVSGTQDTTAPRVTIISPQNQTYSSTAQNVQFSLNEAGTCSYSRDGGATSADMAANSSNTGFTATGSFSTGSNTVSAICQDNAGNVNNTVRVTFTISPPPTDTTPPTITIIAPEAREYTSSNIPFNFGLNEAGSCLYSLNSGAANFSMSANASNTGFTSVRTLSNGSYTATAYCADMAGNRNVAQRAFSVQVAPVIGDASSPVLTFVAPSPSPGSTTGSSVILNLTTSDTSQTYSLFRDGMIAWYRFDNDTGISTGQSYEWMVLGTSFNVTDNGSIYDWSGNNNNASVFNGETGAVPTENGKFGGGYLFDGANDIVTPNLVSEFSSDTITLSLWFNATSEGVLVDELGQRGIGFGWHATAVEILPNREVRVRVWGLEPVSVGIINFGEWNNVVMRYNTQTQTLDGFLNGVRGTSSIGDRVSPMEGGYDLYYGFSMADTANMGSGAYFEGTLDEISIFNRALGDGEVQALYDSQAQALQRPLSGLSGAQTYTANGVDTSGNIGSATLSFTATTSGSGDTTPPVVTVPANIIAEATSAAGRTQTFSASATDETDGSVAVACAPTSGSTFSLGTTTVSCTAQDTAGNTGSASFTITIRDTTAPTIVILGSNPATVTQGTTYNDAGATASDSVSGNLTSQITTNNTVNTAVIGTYTVRYAVQDGAGNSATANRTVNVVVQTNQTSDTTAPTIVVHSPLNTTYTQSAILLNMSASDVSGISARWFAVDGGSSVSYISPATITFANGSHTVIFYANDTSGNIASSSVTFNVNLIAPPADTTPPTIIINSPRNITYSAGTILVNASVTDNNAVNAVWFVHDGVTTVYTAPVTMLFSDGSHTITFYANDTSGNVNTAAITFNVDLDITQLDTTPPSIQYVPPTASADAVLRQNYIEINVTASDENLSTITTRLFNSSHALIAENVSDRSPFYVKHTGLNDGVYYYNATANDMAGNSNSTLTRAISLDTTSPALSIVEPQALMYNAVVRELRYTVSDAHLQACWYSIDNGLTTHIVACGDTITGIASTEGSNTWQVYANDTVGNIASASVTFIQDTVAPSVTFVPPTEESGSVLTTRQNIRVNVSASDLHFANMTISVYNASGDVVQQNTTSSTSFYADYQNMANGTYLITATAYDTAGNSNSTERNVTIAFTTMPQIILESPLQAPQTFLNETSFTLHIRAIDDEGIDTISAVFLGDHIMTRFFVSTTGEINENITDLKEGTYLLHISVNDTDGNVTTLAVDVIIGPQLLVIGPADGAIETATSTNVRFEYRITDEAITQCTLFVNDSPMNTSTNISTNTTLSFVQVLTPGIYRWNLVCTDNTNGTLSSAVRAFNVNAPVATSPSAATSGGGGGGGGGGAYITTVKPNNTTINATISPAVTFSAGEFSNSNPEEESAQSQEDTPEQQESSATGISRITGAVIGAFGGKKQAAAAIAFIAAIVALATYGLRRSRRQEH